MHGTALTQLLVATIYHLEHLGDHGVGALRVSSATLAELSRPTFNSGLATNSECVANKQRKGDLQSSPCPDHFSPASAPTHHRVRLTPPSSKRSAFEQLQARVSICVSCPHLVSSRKNIVFGAGNLESEILFVGEAPGAEEDDTGQPFVGKAGELLNRIIQAMGFSRENVFVANILKCRPDTPGKSSGNRKPSPLEMATCLPYLEEQIDIIRPKVMVALGATAIEGLIRQTPVHVTRIRGQWLQFNEIPLMPTYHPAYLLRNDSITEKRKVWEDMLAVMEKLQLPISHKQRNYFLKPS